jgi:hypothetical protein
MPYRPFVLLLAIVGLCQPALGQSIRGDGDFWLEQVRSSGQPTRFIRARASENPEFPAPLE